MTGGDLQRSRRRRPSGGVDRLPSGRWRARFYGPDARRVAKTFRTKADADAWIASQRVAVLEGRYVDPVAGRVSFGHFAKKWLDGRHDLRPKTRQLYEGLLRRWIVPEFGDIAIFANSAGRRARLVRPPRKPRWSRTVDRSQVLPSPPYDHESRRRRRAHHEITLHHQGRRHRTCSGTAGGDRGRSGRALGCDRRASPSGRPSRRVVRAASR